MLYAFLQRNVPDTDEVLVTWSGDRLRYQLPQQDALPQEPAFEDVVRPLVADNGETRWASPGRRRGAGRRPVGDPR